jgi:hypothetical protein
MVKASGKTAREAFNSAINEAQCERGHGGYTGTIAEKTSYVMIKLPAEYEKRPREYASKLFDNADSRIDNKWGPAGCFDLGNGDYMFFGWASE